MQETSFDNSQTPFLVPKRRAFQQHLREDPINPVPSEPKEGDRNDHEQNKDAYQLPNGRLDIKSVGDILETLVISDVKDRRQPSSNAQRWQVQNMPLPVIASVRNTICRQYGSYTPILTKMCTVSNEYGRLDTFSNRCRVASVEEHSKRRKRVRAFSDGIGASYEYSEASNSSVCSEKESYYRYRAKRKSKSERGITALNSSCTVNFCNSLPITSLSGAVNKESIPTFSINLCANYNDLSEPFNFGKLWRAKTI
ncbi:hypothetical protein V1511DRAFT_16877 [Dipodascopsis uninucleata]